MESLIVLFGITLTRWLGDTESNRYVMSLNLVIVIKYSHSRWSQLFLLLGTKYKIKTAMPNKKKGYWKNI